MAEEVAKEKAADKEAPQEASKKEAPKEGAAAPAEGEAAAGGDKKKMLMMVGVGAAVLLIVAGIATWFFVLRKPATPDADAVMSGAPASGTAGASVFYDVPEFSLNLAQTGQQDHFLRLKVTLELASADEEKQVEANAARLQDDYLQYLRQLRLDDLRGNAGLQRIKEDLLLRASQTLAPVRIKNVLFREVLVQ
jgi:flagellar FliL protein